jgi:outer membrane receptor for ferrienterochelin and colicins
MTVLLVRRWALFLVGAALSVPGAHAQSTEPEPAPAPALAPTPNPNSQRVEITGGRAGDSEQRRQSTAAKIVIGREEIERYGDSNTLELLKRLPGITIPGAPGRGGNPRLRGMGGGFTQILVDGERIAPGFSLDAIPPEQIERIEILRAPTAETGARAIAGTINIVLREGFRRKVNDLNLEVQREAGETGGGLSWTRNDTFGSEWTLNSSLSLFRRNIVNQSTSRRTDVDRVSGATLLLRDGTSDGRTQRDGVHAHARLQWRDEDGRSLVLTPLVIAARSDSRTLSTLTNAPQDYASADTHGDARFSLARVNAVFAHRLGASGPRLEWRAGIGQGHWQTDSARREFDDAQAPVRSIDESSDNRDRNATLGLKASLLAGAGHQLVSGIELERNRRTDGKTTLIDGVPQLTEFGDNLQASARRWALYGQDEWSIRPQWAVHVGLRAEGIVTEGEGANGEVDVNHSRVVTPLLHAVWKFDEKARDQLRASLTRSYRAPNLGQLIGRPSVSRIDPAPGANTELTADSAGNPALKPEVAIGIDLAVERYLADGGVLSANLFHRRINDLIRSVVALEDVSWSPGQPRYVSRPQNIGKATTQGVELEAKFRLDQLLDDAPRTEVRANASIFRSRVAAVPGPDNRLAEQPGGTLNLGLDHRFRGTPLMVGGNLNHTPGYRTRLEADRTIVQSEKNVLDAYVSWAFSPEAKLRLSLSNALAPDIASTTVVDSATLIETNRTSTRSFVTTQLRLELKL